MSLPFYLSYAGLWMVVVFETVLLLGVIRTVYRKSGDVAMLEKAENRLPPGSRLPEFQVSDIAGETIDSRSLVGRQTALLFVAPSCDSCAVTLEELDALMAKTGGNVIVFCLGDDPACATLVEDYRLRVPVVVDGEQRIARLLRVVSAPTALLVDRLGNVETYGHPRTPVELERILTIVPGEDEFAAGLEIHQEPARTP